MGPTPAEGDVIKLKKRKQISSVKERNYLLISEDFKSLKQNVSFKFQALDFKEAMKLMSEVGQINILVGDDVAGSISAELDNVPWDKAFNALLDLKNYAADIDVASNIIRVSTPANLTSQEGYKSARASAVKKKSWIRRLSRANYFRNFQTLLYNSLRSQSHNHRIIYNCWNEWKFYTNTSNRRSNHKISYC